jgi:Delta7-sterol 5-desaturase
MWQNLVWYHVAWIGVVFFASIYLLFGAVNWLLTHRILPTLGHGGWLNNKPLPAGQIRRELLLSTSSILIFGVGTLVPWAMVQIGWSHIESHASALKIAIEILVLVVWNEAHFYTCHRALHLPALRRFHLPHHRSIVTTPWATYAFHPIEALMLGSVLLIPMLLHDFSFAALVATPLFSLLFNSIGHSNYDFLPGAAKDRWWLNGARRHHQHHVSYHGNYGFMFPFIDRWLGTALPIDKAHA